MSISTIILTLIFFLQVTISNGLALIRVFRVLIEYDYNRFSRKIHSRSFSADSNKLLNGELDKEFSSTILRAINRLDKDDKEDKYKSASFLAPTIFPTPTATPSSSYTFPPTRTKPSKGTPASQYIHINVLSLLERSHYLCEV
jgi:hypothetical protein